MLLLFPALEKCKGFDENLPFLASIHSIFLLSHFLTLKPQPFPSPNHSDTLKNEGFNALFHENLLCI